MKRIQITLRIGCQDKQLTGAILAKMIENILLDELPIDIENEKIIYEVWESK